jgi:hypothetical protein
VTFLLVKAILSCSSKSDESTSAPHVSLLIKNKALDNDIVNHTKSIIQINQTHYCTPTVFKLTSIKRGRNLNTDAVARTVNLFTLCKQRRRAAREWRA